MTTKHYIVILIFGFFVGLGISMVAAMLSTGGKERAAAPVVHSGY